MIIEIDYSDLDDELESGTCTECKKESDKIVYYDGRCVPCIEKEAFHGLKVEKK